MYSSHSLSKRYLYVHFFVDVAIQLLFICNAFSLNLTNTYLNHKCLVSEGVYKPGSAYEKNLIKHISLASNGTFAGGFYHGTIGDPDYSTIIYQCRGDSYLSKCRACFLTAINELRKRCPKNKVGIIWFDQCFVEISKILVWTANEEEKFDHTNDFSLHNPNKVNGDTKFFNKDTMVFLEQLTLKANNKGNRDKNGEMTMYVAGEKSLGTKKLYAMVQCTKYIYVSAKMCKKCLDTIIEEFPKCCGDKQGGRILGTSCNFRYELYPFLKN